MLEYNDTIEDFGYSDDSLVVDNELLLHCISANSNNFIDYCKDTETVRYGKRKIASDLFLNKWVTNGLLHRNGMKVKGI